MYKGEINITQMELPGLLNCAESLQVKGLAKINPLKASGLLQEVCQRNSCGKTSKLEPSRLKLQHQNNWKNNSFLSYGEDEEAVEITEIPEDREENLLVDEGK